MQAASASSKAPGAPGRTQPRGSKAPGCSACGSARPSGDRSTEPGRPAPATRKRSHKVEEQHHRHHSLDVPRGPRLLATLRPHARLRNQRLGNEPRRRRRPAGTPTDPRITQCASSSAHLHAPPLPRRKSPCTAQTPKPQRTAATRRPLAPGERHCSASSRVFQLALVAWAACVRRSPSLYSLVAWAARVRRLYAALFLSSRRMGGACAPLSLSTAYSSRRMGGACTPHSLSLSAVLSSHAHSALSTVLSSHAHSACAPLSTLLSHAQRVCAAPALYCLLILISPYGRRVCAAPSLSTVLSPHAQCVCAAPPL